MTTTALQNIQAAFPNADSRENLDSVVLTVQPDALEATLGKLKNDPQFGCSLLLDVTAIDFLTYPEPQPTRFVVVYILRNPESGLQVQVRVPVADPDTGIPSATKLWGSAIWGEREAYDQYGVRFNGHHDLRRILNHWQFVGHPLRKDYDILQG